MNEVERLREWMNENDHTVSTLAKSMGFTYDGVYQALNVRGYLSPEFKWQFKEAFGWEEANMLFDTNSQPHSVGVA